MVAKVDGVAGGDVWVFAVAFWVEGRLMKAGNLGNLVCETAVTRVGVDGIILSLGP